jgi:hypothetical protein
MKTTKFLIVLLMIFIFNSELQSQCISNAGNDTTFCSGSDSSFLGGYPALPVVCHHILTHGRVTTELPFF